MKAYDEEGNLLDPADFGEEDYVTEGLEMGADYVIAHSDSFPHPPEFYPKFVMSGYLKTSKRRALQSGHIYRVWDLTRGVIGAPPPTVTPPPEPKEAIKAYDEYGNLLAPADFGEEDYIWEGLEQGADYVIATCDAYSHPPEFYPKFVMSGYLKASKRQTLKSGHIYRVWDLTRGVITAPPPTVTPPPEPPAVAEPIEPPACEEPPPAQYEAPREFIYERREAERAEESTESDETDEERAPEAAQGPSPGSSLLVGWVGFSIAVIGGSAAHFVWGNFGAGPEGALVFGLIGGGFGCGYAAGFLTSAMWPRS